MARVRHYAVQRGQLPPSALRRRASLRFFQSHQRTGSRSPPALRRSRVARHVLLIFLLRCLALFNLSISLFFSARLAWFQSEATIKIGVFDATNSSRKRRAWIKTKCEEAGVSVLFLESVCTDNAIIESNVRATKLKSPDYANRDPEDAVVDFRKRIAEYEKVYETVGEAEEQALSYIQLINAGRRTVVNNVFGYTRSIIVSFLLNLRLRQRPIYLSRHGQSEYNAVERIGGDSALTPKGIEYAKLLSKYVQEVIIPENPGQSLQVWTSTLRRTKQTAEYIGREFQEWRALDEIEAGEMNGMTYEEIKEKYPKDYEERKKSKLTYRYPRGESYQDLILRLDPVVLELERGGDSPVLIIAHQGVCRVILAYFAEKSQVECPRLEVPLHNVIKLIPNAYGCDVEVNPLGENLCDVQSH
eukprot:TRINITY_DN9498_c0_g1_i6.p1 TRINITY_DN9498_c0_g1~~TRINITY_DN9498_c0_g1_i6.p1  ORF type:complete len:416 (+),score=73.38 TRINITY_DN9498_c0_g1_i6:497-1744(+)